MQRDVRLEVVSVHVYIHHYRKGHICMAALICFVGVVSVVSRVVYNAQNYCYNCVLSGKNNNIMILVTP